VTYIGELAALTTATLWAFGSLFFTVVARRVGAFSLNAFRITLALPLLAGLLFASGKAAGFPEPGDPALLWLGLSGFVGLTIGDFGTFGAMARIGPRVSTLLGALSPPITAVLALVLLGEGLPPIAVAGMALTIVGVAWVVLERPAVEIPRGHRVQGVLLGVLSAVCQAVGLVLARKGMGQTVDPLVATVIRMGAAGLGLWLLALVSGRLDAAWRVVADRTSLKAALVATVLGPVFGVWLSQVALQRAGPGVAATLLSTTPLLILPLVIVGRREKVSPRAAIGAAVAVSGVALLFLRH
jgi:drug/metabolite transporter (DMT)-like permease